MTARFSAPRSGLLLALCLLLVTCVYVRALGGPFLWDDRPMIVDSPAVRELNIVQAFRQPFWLGESGRSGSMAYYRPLTTISCAFDYWLYGSNSSGFHLSSLLLHLLAVSLLFGLLRRRGAGGLLAALLACCWALLPRLTEAAAWISGRGDLLVTVASLAVLAIYRPGSARRFSGALLFALLALFAKESGIAVLVALLLLELRQAAPRESLSRRYRVALLGLPLGLYAGLRYAAGSSIAGESVRLGALERLLASLEALGRYAFMLVNPLQPRSVLGQLGRVDWWFVGLGAVVLAALLVALAHYRRLAPETLALVTIALVSIGIVLHVTPVRLTVVAADRYLYLPSAALLLALVPALARVPHRQLIGVLAVCTVACGARTFERVGDYLDEAQFWTTAVRTTPQDDTPYVGLGSVAYGGGFFSQALALNLRGISLGGQHAGQALENAALAAAACGDRVLAARLGDELVRRFPRQPAFELRRAVIALNAHDFANAERHVHAALVLAPDFAPAQVFSRLVLRARTAAADPDLPPAAAQSMDIEVIRYPEIVARLDKLLELPQSQDPTLLVGLEFMINSGPPQQARQLVTSYAKRGDRSTNERLAAALATRLEAAAAIQTQLKRLDETK